MKPADVDAATVASPAGEDHAEIAAAQQAKRNLIRSAFERFHGSTINRWGHSIRFVTSKRIGLVRTRAVYGRCAK